MTRISIGEWTKKLSDTLGVQLVLPAILEDMEVDDPKFDKSATSLAFDCVAPGYGDFAFVGSKQSGKWSVAFGVAARPNLKLPEIPLLSEALHTLELNKIGVIVTGDSLPPSDLLKQYDLFSSKDLKEGVSIAAVMTLGDKPLTTTRLIKLPSIPLPSGGGGGGGGGGVDWGGLFEKMPSIGWLKLGQDYGPVHIEKIGFSFQDGQRVAITPALSVKLSALKVELNGLSLSLPLKAPTGVDFKLDGMGFSYTSPALTISSAFLHTSSADGESYAGEALIGAAEFNLSALGAYFRSKRGDPALFMYMDYDGELGGPPFFFVKGLSGGFGYNYSLRTPGIDSVKSFPFVAQATGSRVFGSPAPMAALDTLKDVVQPRFGQDWLAAGVRFTTFELLDSFALLTAQVGTNFEVALLGLSTLKLPPEAPYPIAQAQLALEADISPSSGLLRVEGKLTPESFILARECKLTGGFAFCMWFSGDHAGDFVISLGGYNPAFVKPEHYPDEPRVGFNWQIGGDLHIEGHIYFALTPSALMAGAGMSATYQSGGLRAWFTEQVDFLLRWKPFQYDIGLKIGFGVSYRIHVAFVSVTVTVHLGVDVHLHGPPFAGKATFHVGPFDVSIKFGSGEAPDLPPLAWPEFSESFLPGADAVVRAAISSGVAKGPTSPIDIATVDPDTLELALSTNIPIKTAAFNAQNFKGGDPWTTGFGVGPCAVRAENFGSDCAVTIQRREGLTSTPSPCDLADFIITPELSRSPQSLWGTAHSLGDRSWLNEPALFERTLTGFTIVPARKPAGHCSGPYEKQYLKATYNSLDELHFSWAPPPPTRDDFHQNQAMDELVGTIADAKVAEKRTEILAALRSLGLDIEDTRPNLSPLKERAAQVLLAAPVLSLLGEEKRRAAVTGQEPGSASH